MILVLIPDKMKFLSSHHAFHAVIDILLSHSQRKRILYLLVNSFVLCTNIWVMDFIRNFAYTELIKSFNLKLIILLVIFVILVSVFPLWLISQKRTSFLKTLIISMFFVIGLRVMSFFERKSISIYRNYDLPIGIIGISITFLGGLSSFFLRGKIGTIHRTQTILEQLMSLFWSWLFSLSIVLMHHITMLAMTMKQEDLIFMNTHIMTIFVAIILICLILMTLLLCLIYHNDLKYCPSSDIRIAKLEKRIEQLSELALLDSLTKLSNRFSLKNHIDSLIETSKQTKKNFFVLFIDIDDFKPVNDTYGHDIGDRLLCKISRRIRHSIRKSDFASRIGGDEFILIIDGHTNCTIHIVANRLISKLTQPYHITDNLMITISVSIGISIFPADGIDGDIIIKHADTAMYKAKCNGKNGFCFYQSCTDI